MVGTRDKDCGTKDTHINFGECLDSVDWNEAELHCGKADLCVIAGTSMSLRHITHFPFMAKKTVLINLQATPDDSQATLRIWAKCDPVFQGLMERLCIPIDPIPAWRPRDSVPISQIPSYVHPHYVGKARDLESMAQLRDAEAQDRLREERERERKREASGEPDVTVATLPRAPVIGNKHKTLSGSVYDDCNLHRWTMFVALPKEEESQRDQEGKAHRIPDRLGRYVDHVEYQLHPTFSPSTVRVGEDSAYEIRRTGWGTFDVGVTVHWHADMHHEPSRFTHRLSFKRNKTANTVAVV
eukprot:TRINITY_DN8251_c0_g1_i2.p1 TRINITY_DN8251_c0_g1~~TRINITY_DN8251_c0_g1_i2.p1  ORF type:complete len:298 (+),score=48.73 TRINITY_DN8251_c0_g1_i2:91-984(+)